MRCFKVISWNVNGLRALLKKDTLVPFVERERPDVLLFNETKIDETVIPSVADMLAPQGYKSHWATCTTKKGYSGVAAFTRVDPIRVQAGFGAGHDDEGRTLTLETKEMVIVAAYVPNSGMKLERLDYRTKEWDPAFAEYLQRVSKAKPLLLCGDLNVAHLDVDVHDPKANKNKTPGFCDAERENFGRLLDAGFVDLWREEHGAEAEGYTYWSYRFNAKQKNKGWRLDYMVASKGLRDAAREVSTTVYGDVAGSDHYPLGATFTF